MAQRETAEQQARAERLVAGHNVKRVHASTAELRERSNICVCACVRAVCVCMYVCMHVYMHVFMYIQYVCERERERERKRDRDAEASHLTPALRIQASRGSALSASGNQRPRAARSSMCRHSCRSPECLSLSIKHSRNPVFTNFVK